MDVLYDDLEDFLFTDSTPRDEPCSQELSEVTSELSEVKESNTKLTAQNVALKKNISCLYKTARSELQRKEDEIDSLNKKATVLEAALQELSETCAWHIQQQERQQSNSTSRSTFPTSSTTTAGAPLTSNDSMDPSLPFSSSHKEQGKDRGLEKAAMSLLKSKPAVQGGGDDKQPRIQSRSSRSSCIQQHINRDTRSFKMHNRKSSAENIPTNTKTNTSSGGGDKLGIGESPTTKWCGGDQVSVKRPHEEEHVQSSKRRRHSQHTNTDPARWGTSTSGHYLAHARAHECTPTTTNGRTHHRDNHLKDRETPSRNNSHSYRGSRL